MPANKSSPLSEAVRATVATFEGRLGDAANVIEGITQRYDSLDSFILAMDTLHIAG